MINVNWSFTKIHVLVVFIPVLHYLIFPLIKSYKAFKKGI